MLIIVNISWEIARIRGPDIEMKSHCMLPTVLTVRRCLYNPLLFNDWELRTGI
jgi:hypothetical protein